MTTAAPELQPSYLLPVGAVMLALLLWGRALGKKAFSSAPNRAIGLGLPDLLAGLGLTVLGMLLSGSLRAWLGIAPESSPGAKTAAVLLSQVSVQLLPVLYLLARAATAAPQGLQRIGAVPTRPWRDVIAGIGGFLVAAPIVFAVLVASGEIARWLGHPPETLGHELLPLLHDERSDPQVLLLLTVAVVIVAPVLEEFLFRGLMQSSLVEALGGRRWPALLLTAAGFTIMHVGAVEPASLLGLFTLAVGFGWLYERTGSLWPCVLMHALFNAANLAIAMLFVPPASGG